MVEVAAHVYRVREEGFHKLENYRLVRSPIPGRWIPDCPCLAYVVPDDDGGAVVVHNSFMFGPELN